jgi:hypothetical protein
MKKELKRAIVNYILDNEKEFQIMNATTKNFRLYIYDDKGEYLIGGEEISEFIVKQVELLRSY